MLLTELKKIEARKRERERKTQDLQKLISRADSGTTPVVQATNNESPITPANVAANIARRHDRKIHKKKLTSQQRPIRAVESVVSYFLY